MRCRTEAEVEEVLPRSREGVSSQRSLLIRAKCVGAGAEVDEVVHVLAAPKAGLTSTKKFTHPLQMHT